MGTGEEPPARRPSGGRRRRWADREDGDDDYDDEDFVAEEEEEDGAEELSASSAGEDGEDSDAEYQEEEEEEEEEQTPRPKRPVKGGARGQKGKLHPAKARAKRRRYEMDDDYEEEEPSEDEEVEEYDEETPPPKRPVKGGSACWGKERMDPAASRGQRRRYEVDDDYEEEPDEEEEPEPEPEPEPDEDEDEEYHEEFEEEETPTPVRPKSPAQHHGQNVELPRSHRRKYEDDDMDFEPELDEEEVDEDIDFDPEADDEDEDDFEDEEEEVFGVARARKVTVKSPANRKSVSKRRVLKKKKASKRSKASKRKIGSAKAKKSAHVKRVRKRFVVDESDEDSEDDEDFLVDDQIEVDRPPRKKARTGTNKKIELECPSVFDEATWPNVESETSEFEFVTSDEEPDDAGTTVVEANGVRKRRKKRKSGSDSSSDSEFVVSDKELKNLRETEPQKVQLVPPTPIRKHPVTRHGEDKGKKKEEPEEAGTPICGICLSEEQRATVRGILNCCSHYFCFACIMEWSKVESRCPLCKQRFTTIAKYSKADLGLGLRKAIIKVEERDQVYQPTEEEIRRWLDPYENVVCIECQQGGDDSLMLLCDICDSSAHTYCVGLGREVPEGNWYCGGCRLNDEGPSHARITHTLPHTVAYERQSYRNHVDFGSVGFGMTAQNSTYNRSSSLNHHNSFHGIDLNLSPREVPGEVHPAESQQVSTDSVSTPSGRSTTVSTRRQIHRYIRILLSRPRTEPNNRRFRSSSEANTSQILPDGIQNQRNGLPFAPSMPLDGDDFQHMDGVKSNLSNMQ